jgi:hypothetical protein
VVAAGLQREKAGPSREEGSGCEVALERERVLDTNIYVEA